jgi:hypothetical protein
MIEIDLSCAEWHKSSYSGQSGNCVEVARNLPGLVAVRDSKEPDGVKLVVSQETWRAFIMGYSSASFLFARTPFGRRW